MVLKKWKSNPKNEMPSFLFESIGLWFDFSLFHFTDKMKKKKMVSRSPLQLQVTLTAFFPQVFQFSLQTEKTVGTAYLGVYCPSFYLNQS